GATVRQQSTMDEQNRDLFSAPQQNMLWARGARSPASLTERIGVALQATHTLAFPRQPVPDALYLKEDQAQRLADTAEEVLLRETLEVLNALALPRVAGVVVPGGKDVWHELPAATEDRFTLLDIPRWPKFVDGGAIVLTAGRRTELWARLAPWW